MKSRTSYAVTLEELPLVDTLHHAGLYNSLPCHALLYYVVVVTVHDPELGSFTATSSFFYSRLPHDFRILAGIYNEKMRSKGHLTDES